MSKPTTFGVRLKRLREDRSLTQLQLANATQLQPSAISHMEADRRAPSLPTLERLLIALRVSPAEAWSLIMGAR